MLSEIVITKCGKLFIGDLSKKPILEKATADREVRYSSINDLYIDFLNTLSSLTSTKEYNDLSIEKKIDIFVLVWLGI